MSEYKAARGASSQKLRRPCSPSWQFRPSPGRGAVVNGRLSKSPAFALDGSTSRLPPHRLRQRRETETPVNSGARVGTTGGGPGFWRRR